jgi:hypothetical protein
MRVTKLALRVTDIGSGAVLHTAIFLSLRTFARVWRLKVAREVPVAGIGEVGDATVVIIARRSLERTMANGPCDLSPRAKSRERVDGRSRPTFLARSASDSISLRIGSNSRPPSPRCGQSSSCSTLRPTSPDRSKRFVRRRPLLAHLRDLQRCFALVVVHHARKGGGIARCPLSRLTAVLGAATWESMAVI